MLIWCGILFGLGILAFADSIFNYGDIFRQVNSVIFLLTALGLLVRTTTKIRARKFESTEAKLERLEVELRNLKRKTDSKAPVAR